TALVFLRHPIGGVVDLEKESRARRDQFGHPVGIDVWPGSRYGCRQPVGDEATVAIRAGSTRRLDEYQDMVHDGPASRLHFGGPDPFIFGKTRIDGDELVLDRPL